MRRFFFTTSSHLIILLRILAIISALGLTTCSLSACTKPLKPISQLQVSQNTISAGLIEPQIMLLGSLTKGTAAHTQSLEQPSYLWSMGSSSQNNPITAIAYNAKTQQALTASNNQLVIWNTKTGQSKHFLSAPAKINAIAINPNGTHAILGLQNHQAQVLNLNIGGITQTLAHNSPVLSVAFNEQYLLTGEENNKAHLWQLGQKKAAYTHQHNDGVTKTGFSPNGQYAITAGRYDTITLLNVKNPKNISTAQTIAIKAMALKAGKRLIDFKFTNNTQILLAYSDNIIQHYDMQQKIVLKQWSTAKKTMLAKDNSTIIALGQYQNKWWVLNSAGKLFELGAF